MKKAAFALLAVLSFAVVAPVRAEQPADVQQVSQILAKLKSGQKITAEEKQTAVAFFTAQLQDVQKDFRKYMETQAQESVTLGKATQEQAEKALEQIRAMPEDQLRQGQSVVVMMLQSLIQSLQKA